MNTNKFFSVTVDTFHESSRPGGIHLEISLHCSLCNHLVCNWRPPTPLTLIEQEAARHVDSCLQKKGRT